MIGVVQTSFDVSQIVDADWWLFFVGVVASFDLAVEVTAVFTDDAFGDVVVFEYSLFAGN